MIIEYILLGSFVGLLSGIFGIGGSIICTPLLILFFNTSPFIALASPLPVTIPAAISGICGYWSKNLINKKIVIYTIIGGLPATIIGALITKIVCSHWLMILNGLLIIILGLRLMVKKNENKNLSNIKISKSMVALIIGIVAGFFSGLLAIGGGVFIVPLYILFLGLSMQEAAATSLVCVAFFAIPGTLTHWWIGNIDWNIVFILSLGVIPAGYIGSKIALLLKSGHIQLVFGLFLILFGIYFTYKYL